MKRVVLACTQAALFLILTMHLTAAPAAAVCGDAVIDAGEECDDGNLIAGDCCDPSCLFETGPGAPPCCSNGLCSVAASCGSACFAQLHCNYAGEPQSTCVCEALQPAPPLEHYRVYAATGTDIAPPVTLRDQFQTQRTLLGGTAQALLVPTQKNSEGTPDPFGPHLTCYEISGEPFAATVSITNQFGPQVLEVRDPAFLCVPTDKHVAPGPNPGVLDHFKCYESSSPFLGPLVTLQDQFQTEFSVLIGNPLLFCNPVDKNGEGIERPLDHLTCYWTEPSTFVPGNVQIMNQFGPDTLDVAEPSALCVPTIKEDVQLQPLCGETFPTCDGACPAYQSCGQLGICLGPVQAPCDPADPQCPFGAFCSPISCICRYG